MSREQNSGSQGQKKKKGILNLGRHHTLSASMSPATIFSIFF